MPDHRLKVIALQQCLPYGELMVWLPARVDSFQDHAVAAFYAAAHLIPEAIQQRDLIAVA